MSKYEIMILVNPTSTEESVKDLVFSVLDEKNTKFERLERTELAYPINKLTRATYFLILTSAQPELIKELTRKFNIDKSIIRSLIINLNSEKGLKPRKQRRFTKRNFENRRSFDKNENKEATSNDRRNEQRRPYIKKQQPVAK
ncbi:30S ribosomal protein S6 [Mycoplasma sp. 332]|uniref:30S ribosomal protein S6 n=1 Tax=unclassified Asterococcus (in: mycoplasmas, genus) TaxID=3407551 RepID=UPI003F655B26